jgi:hypothetical protein
MFATLPPLSNLTVISLCMLEPDPLMNTVMHGALPRVQCIHKRGVHMTCAVHHHVYDAFLSGF